MCQQVWGDQRGTAGMLLYERACEKRASLSVRANATHSLWGSWRSQWSVSTATLISCTGKRVSVEATEIQGVWSAVFY